MNRLISTILFFLAIASAWSQTEYKTLKEQDYEVGDRIRIPELTYCTGYVAPLCPETYDSISVVGAFLREHPELHVVLEAHTDRRGSDEQNLKLSQSQAELYRQTLHERHQIQLHRIVARGMGEHYLIVPDDLLDVASIQSKEEMHHLDRRFLLRVFAVEERPTKEFKIDSVKVYECVDGRTYTIRTNMLFLRERMIEQAILNDPPNDYEDRILASLSPEDYEEVKRAAALLLQDPKSELLVNHCIDDGFSFVIHIYSDHNAKRILVRNYFDDRVNGITKLIDQHHRVFVQMGYRDIPQVIMNQDGCQTEIAEEYRTHLLKVWCQME